MQNEKQEIHTAFPCFPFFCLTKNLSLPALAYLFRVSLTFQDNKLIFTFNHETLWIAPWGDNAFRIRAAKKAAMPQKNWALTQPHSASAQYTPEGEGAAITNGKLTIHVSKRGKITATNQKGQVLLEEYCRNRRDLTDPKCSAIEVEGREFAPILNPGQRTRRVNLPQGASWEDKASGTVYQGGQWVEVPSPLHTMPVFRKV